MNVTIKYIGPVVEDFVRQGCPICDIFLPTGSYVNTPVYTQGYPVDAADEDKEYGKSVYATNVAGRGYLPGLHPMANTATPFAYFERAIIVAGQAAKAGEANNGVTFTVADDDYKGRIYWEQMCANLVDNGFYSKVGEVEFGVDPAAADAAEATTGTDPAE